MHKIPFTKDGFNKLKIGLDKLVTRRPEAVKTLSRARDMGDLSENGLYKAAKFELSDIDRNIRHLRNLIKYANVLTPNSNNLVQIGHKVIVESESGKKEFNIVGEWEADPKQNKISNKSPIGFALMGKSVGEKAIVKTPSGENKYKIISIS